MQLSQDTMLHVGLAIGSGLFTGVFSAGVTYTWAKMSIAELQKNADRNHKELRDLADKNYETLDKKIKEVADEINGDLAGIGNKVSRIGEYIGKKFDNTSTALMLVAGKKKQAHVSVLMKTA